MAEMHVILATIIRHFDLELVETERQDIEFDRDFMLPMRRASYRNLKSVVKGTRL
jgi:hypothetical protein